MLVKQYLLILCIVKPNEMFFRECNGSIITLLELFLSRCLNDRSDANFNHCVFDSLSIVLNIAGKCNIPEIGNGIEKYSEMIISNEYNEIYTYALQVKGMII